MEMPSGCACLNCIAASEKAYPYEDKAELFERAKTEPDIRANLQHVVRTSDQEPVSTGETVNSGKVFRSRLIWNIEGLTSDQFKDRHRGSPPSEFAMEPDSRVFPLTGQAHDLYYVGGDPICRREIVEEEYVTSEQLAMERAFYPTQASDTKEHFRELMEKDLPRESFIDGAQLQAQLAQKVGSAPEASWNASSAWTVPIVSRPAGRGVPVRPLGAPSLATAPPVPVFGVPPPSKGLFATSTPHRVATVASVASPSTPRTSSAVQPRPRCQSAPPSPLGRPLPGSPGSNSSEISSPPHVKLRITSPFHTPLRSSGPSDQTSGVKQAPPFPVGHGAAGKTQNQIVNLSDRLAASKALAQTGKAAKDDDDDDCRTSVVPDNLKHLPKFERPIHRYTITEAQLGQNVVQSMKSVRRAITEAQVEGHPSAGKLGDFRLKLAACHLLLPGTIENHTMQECFTALATIEKEDELLKQTFAALANRTALEDAPPRATKLRSKEFFDRLLPWIENAERASANPRNASMFSTFFDEEDASSTGCIMKITRVFLINNVYKHFIAGGSRQQGALLDFACLVDDNFKTQPAWVDTEAVLSDALGIVLMLGRIPGLRASKISHFDAMASGPLGAVLQESEHYSTLKFTVWAQHLAEEETWPIVESTWSKLKEWTPQTPESTEPHSVTAALDFSLEQYPTWRLSLRETALPNTIEVEVTRILLEMVERIDVNKVDLSSEEEDSASQLIRRLRAAQSLQFTDVSIGVGLARLHKVTTQLRGKEELLAWTVAASSLDEQPHESIQRLYRTMEVSRLSLVEDSHMDTAVAALTNLFARAGSVWPLNDDAVDCAERLLEKAVFNVRDPGGEKADLMVEPEDEPMDGPEAEKNKKLWDKYQSLQATMRGMKTIRDMNRCITAMDAFGSTAESRVAHPSSLEIAKSLASLWAEWDGNKNEIELAVACMKDKDVLAALRHNASRYSEGYAGVYITGAYDPVQSAREKLDAAITFNGTSWREGVGVNATFKTIVNKTGNTLQTVKPPDLIEKIKQLQISLNTVKARCDAFNQDWQQQGAIKNESEYVLHNARIVLVESSFLAALSLYDGGDRVTGKEKLEAQMKSLAAAGIKIHEFHKGLWASVQKASKNQALV